MFTKLIATSLKPTLRKTALPLVPQIRFAPQIQTRSFSSNVFKSIQEDKLPKIPSDWNSDHVKTFLNKFADQYHLSTQKRQQLFDALRTYNGEELFKFDDKSFQRVLKDEQLSQDLFREMGGTLTAGQLTADLIAKSTTYLAPLLFGIAVGLFLYFKDKKSRKHLAETSTQSQTEETEPPVTSQKA